MLLRTLRCESRCLTLVQAFLLLPAIAAAGPVGSEFQVNTFTPYNQKTPSVATNSQGAFLVVWESRGEEGLANSGVYGQAWAGTGTPVGAEFHVNTYTNFDQKAPDVADQGNGTFVVVWQSCCNQDGWLTSVRARRYDAAGNPMGGEFGVNTYTINDQDNPAVAADASGNFVVVWRSYVQDGSFSGVFGQRFNAAGARLGSEFRVNTYTSSQQDHPRVAMDASGNFVVVWQSLGQECVNDNNPVQCLPRASAGVFARRYTPSGTPVSAEFQVNSYSTGPQTQPAVAMDPSGNVIVSWTSVNQDGSGSGVYGRRFNSSGSPLGAEFRVNVTTTNSQSEPAVTAGPTGDFVMTWSGCCEAGTTGSGIFGQRFSGTGARLGSEFRVNSYTTGAQITPVVDVLPEGGFVVAWNSLGQDGSLDGIFGQRFDDVIFRNGFE